MSEAKKVQPVKAATAAAPVAEAAPVADDLAEVIKQAEAEGKKVVRLGPNAVRVDH